MKTKKLFVVLSTIIIGFSLQSKAQDTSSMPQSSLPPVTVTALRYKYLTAIGHNEASPSVKMLQQKVAEYNVKNSSFYEDDYDTYFISFYIPDGQILAVYDNDGKLLRTAEKYKNIALPKEVTSALAARFPNWSINGDAYLVSYFGDNNTAKKLYKLTLQNADKRMRVKLNEQGEFL